VRNLEKQDPGEVYFTDFMAFNEKNQRIQNQKPKTPSLTIIPPVRSLLKFRLKIKRNIIKKKKED
jgi:hypothetical protein